MDGLVRWIRDHLLRPAFNIFRCPWDELKLQAWLDSIFPDDVLFCTPCPKVDLRREARELQI
eukprot:5228566-Prorocentrum_lima.AAC.1